MNISFIDKDRSEEKLLWQIVKCSEFCGVVCKRKSNSWQEPDDKEL
jgi:hypothetical protein